MKNGTKIILLLIIGGILIAGAIVLVINLPKIIFKIEIGENEVFTPENTETVEQNNDVNGNIDSQSDRDSASVVFLSVDGSVLHETVLKKGETLQLLENPIMPQGYVFQGWNKYPIHVEEDCIIQAIAEEIPKGYNVLALSGGFGRKGDTVELVMQLCGTVDICAFDIKLLYDTNKLEFVEITDQDSELIANCISEEGVILMNFLSSSNVNGDVDLCKLTFRICSSDIGESKVSIAVKKAVHEDNGEFLFPEIKTISGTVTVLE